MLLKNSGIQNRCGIILALETTDDFKPPYVLGTGQTLMRRNLLGQNCFQGPEVSELSGSFQQFVLTFCLQ